ncbi:MAG: helix-turn-helix domain-containing protein [Janthinobacterium lividum]
MTSTASTQATRLTALRRQSGLSLHQVAEKLTKAMDGARRSHTTIQRYEKDPEIRVSRPVLAALAKIYRTTPEYIEHGEAATPKEGMGFTDVGAEDANIIGIISRLNELDYVDLPLIKPSAYSAFAANCQGSRLKGFVPFYILKIPGVDYHDAAALEMRGNSMAPRYPEASQHVMRPVSHNNWQYAQGVHAIVLNSEMVVVKRITNNQEGIITLSSDNGGSTMSVALTDIKCMWKISETVYMPAEE